MLFCNYLVIFHLYLMDPEMGKKNIKIYFDTKYYFVLQINSYLMDLIEMVSYFLSKYFSFLFFIFENTENTLPKNCLRHHIYANWCIVKCGR